MSAAYVEYRDAVYRVAGTGISLDSIVQPFLAGHSAEKVAQAFPALRLEQVHGAIAFYLAHRDEVDRHLAGRSGSAETRGDAETLAPVIPDGSHRREAEQASRERLALQERLARIVATAPGIVYAFRLRPDGTSCIPYASPRIEDVYGIRPEGLTADASPALAMTHPDDAARFRESIAESARTLSPWRCEFRVLNRQKGEIWVEGHSTPEREPDGGILWHGFINDITERKRTEEALRASEERYRSLFANMREGLAYCRMLIEDGRPVDFIYLEVNPAFEALTGLKDVVGRRVTEVIPGLRASNPELFEIYGRVAETGRPANFETYIEGLGIWVHVSAYRPREGHFTAVFSNITERKRKEEVLKRQEERLRLAIEGAALATWRWDIASGQLIWSDRCYAIFGLPPGSPVTNERFRAAIHPDDREAVETATRDALAGSVYDVEYRTRWPDGTEHWIAAWGRTYHDAEGKPSHMEGVAREVTESKRLEEQLRQAQKLEAVGRLAGGVAHDFNNLLGVITGYAELAARQLEGHPARARIEEVRKAADRAAALTRQLLAFSRRQVLQPKVVDLGLLVADLQRMLQRLLGEDVDLVVSGGDGLGTVRVDPGQIEQVVMNLAVNARDAMPGGGTLIIATSNVDLDEPLATAHAPVAPGSFVVLAVSDTGHGMDPATRARIFEPFFTTKPPGQGTGLGLATVYGIVKQSGGSITVYSEVGRGTTFKIYLPRIAATAVSAVEELPRESLSGQETILLVEDQEALREVLREGLDSLGYTVLVAAGAAAALALARGHPERIDLLITDVVMPETGGRALASQLVAQRPGLKVLYMSGYTSDVLGRQGVLEEGLDLIEKPFTTGVLARKLREVLDRGEKR